MSVNLMDMVKGAVTQQVMGKLGGLLGTDEKKTSSAFDTAVGSILGGLMKKSSTPQGASDIFDLAKKQDDGVLDKLGDLLGGGKATEDFTKQGGGILDSVMGTDRDGMLGTLAKFLGIKGGMMSTLMSMVAPIVMGVIGRHIKNKAMDAVGLGNLLGEQKNHASSWGLPSSLTSDLGFGNLLGNVGDAGRAAVGAVGDAAGAVGGAASGAAGAVGGAVGGAGRAVSGAAGDAGRAVSGAAGDAASAGGGLLKLLLPLIILGLLAWAAITYLPGMLGGAADAAKDGVNAVGDAAGNAAGAFSMPKIEIPDGMDFGGFDASGMQEKMSGITSGFDGLSMDNAQDFAGKIGDFTGSLDGMGIENIPEAGKGIVGKMFGGFTKALTGGMEGVKDEGILGIIRPVIETLIEKVKSFGFGG